MTNVASAWRRAERIGADVETRIAALEVDATIAAAGPCADARLSGSIDDRRAWDGE